MGKLWEGDKECEKAFVNSKTIFVNANFKGGKDTRATPLAGAARLHAPHPHLESSTVKCVMRRSGGDAVARL